MLLNPHIFPLTVLKSHFESFSPKTKRLNVSTKVARKFATQLAVFKCGKCSWVHLIETIFGAICVLKYARYFVLDYLDQVTISKKKLLVTINYNFPSF